MIQVIIFPRRVSIFPLPPSWYMHRPALLYLHATGVLVPHTNIRPKKQFLHLGAQDI